jgi:hypothetical protein
MTDAVTFERMRQERLKRAFAFDRDFVTAGYELLAQRRDQPFSKMTSCAPSQSTRRPSSSSRSVPCTIVRK